MTIDEGRRTLSVFGDEGQRRSLPTLTTHSVPVLLVAFSLFHLFPLEPLQFLLWSLLSAAAPSPYLFLDPFFFLYEA